MTGKRFVRIFIISITSMFLLVSCLVWYVDPYQFYRKEPKYLISENLRYQYPGLIKNYDYETVILGTSIAHVLIPSYVDSVFNTETMKFSLPGSTLREQFLVGNLIFESKKVKRVIWAIDYFTATRGYEETIKGVQFPYYLYDNNPFNDWVMLFNKSNLVLTIECAFGMGNGENDFDKLQDKYYAETGLNNILSRAHVDSYDFPGEISRIKENLKENIEENILPLILENKDVQFEIYWAPYSIIFLEKDIVRERNACFKELLFDKIGHLDNVKIHDFQAERSYTWNFDNFFDSYHSNPEVGKSIVRDIKSGKYVLDSIGFRQNLKSIESQIELFNLDSYLLNKH